MRGVAIRSRVRRGLGRLLAASLGLGGLPSFGAVAADREIEHQGVTRASIVVNAEAAKAGPRPLWVVLHGRRPVGAQNGSSPVLYAIARREGLIAVYPAAIGGKWNYVGESSPPSMAGSEPADDLGFLVKLIEAMVADGSGDPKRIYVSGASQGGFMTYSLMCSAAARIAAAAPLIASMTEAQIAACAPSRPVPLAVVAGTNDRIVPYDGWLTPQLRLTSVPETMEFWRRRHGCSGMARQPMPHASAADTTRSVRFEWTGCASDGAVRLYRIEGGGHTLPSHVAPPTDEEKNWGRRNSDFETAEELWAFFKPWSL